MTNLIRFSYFFVISLLLIISCEKSPVEISENSHDFVQEVINRMDLDSLSRWVKELSGEDSVSIGGNKFVISSRHKNFLGNDLAVDYIKHKLQSFGLMVEDQIFSATGRNICGIQTGSVYPDQKYIFCAHYDCMPEDSVSPGADDNASGTAAVLETARILSDYSPAYTVMYAFWDEEEQGVKGSQYYAIRATQAGEDIKGVINVDMIGWDSDNDGRFWINVRDTANSTHLSEAILQVREQYQFGLTPQVLNPGYGSDNLPFWAMGFSSIGVEELYGGDWNIHYHTTDDRFSNMNQTYFFNLSKLLASTVTHLAVLGSPVL